MELLLMQSDRLAADLPPSQELLPDQIAQVRFVTPVSVVVPTYKERENLPELVARLDAVRLKHGLTLELLVMDDKSDDGSREWFEQAGYPWVRFIEREGARGLSPAVIDGMRQARHPVVVVMDADLSHPPEQIPAMLVKLHADNELVIGSRYTNGGSTDSDWGFFRWFNSMVATKLAAPLTRASDPMAGFFAFRKAELDRADYLNPIGYKIGLEVIVKCRLTKVAEVPIHFTDRVHGESKLTFTEQLKYLQHLRRLYIYKFGTWSHLAQFIVVGASGVVVNLLVLYALVMMGATKQSAVAGGIGVSICTNFLLNRRFSFSYARSKPLLRQFIGYVGASSIGAGVNYLVALLLLGPVVELPLWLAALSGILAGTFFNFLISRYLVFSAKVRRPALKP